MKFEMYNLIVAQLIDSYDGGMPLSIYLKQYFAAHKKHGSRDRKIITELMYGFYRMGKITQLTTAQRSLIGSYLSGGDIYTYTHPEWPNESRWDYISQQFKTIQPQDALTHLPLLSKHFSISDYLQSIWQKPKTFIKVRYDIKKVESQLDAAGIAYSIEGDTIAVLPRTDIANILKDAAQYVVQDAASQYICNLFETQSKQIWWDACAASGGKSIGLLDKELTIQLYVSDIRETILHNLQQRFKQYKLNYTAKAILDLSLPQLNIFKHINRPYFDGIIVDAPCSGSGTWGRTPEQLYYYKNTVLDFQKKQLAILHNAVPYLKADGKLYYITCSAFAAENEDVVELFLQQHSEMQLKHQQLVNKSSIGGDIMFVAVLEKKK